MEAETRMARRDAPDVIASAAAGDEYAFRRLIAEHQEDMRRVCSYVAGESAIADEATQAAYSGLTAVMEGDFTEDCGFDIRGVVVDGELPATPEIIAGG